MVTPEFIEEISMTMFLPRARQVRTAMFETPAALSRWVSARCVRQHRIRRDLAVLSDRTLADIGLSRTVSLHVTWPQRHSLTSYV